MSARATRQVLTVALIAGLAVATAPTGSHVAHACDQPATITCPHAATLHLCRKPIAIPDAVGPAPAVSSPRPAPIAVAAPRPLARVAPAHVHVLALAPKTSPPA